MRWRDWASAMVLSWLAVGCAKPIQFLPVEVSPMDDRIDLRVQLRLSDETCAWPKKESGESFCAVLRSFAESLFVEVETVRGPDPHPVGEAHAMLDLHVVYLVEEERFIGENIPHVGIEWALTNVAGGIAWVETIQSSGDGDLEDEKRLQAALRRALEQTAAAIRESPEVAALADRTE